jgi:hypothetical protein
MVGDREKGQCIIEEGRDKNGFTISESIGCLPDEYCKAISEDEKNIINTNYNKKFKCVPKL